MSLTAIRGGVRVVDIRLPAKRHSIGVKPAPQNRFHAKYGAARSQPVGPISDAGSPMPADLRIRGALATRLMNLQKFKTYILRSTAVVMLLALVALPLCARGKSGIDYGAGLIVNIPLPETEVLQVVSEAAQNGIIHGTKSYEKDEYIKGAEAAASSNAFPAWQDAGKIFYKVKKQALDPRNFKDSGDLGTLTVRYIVQSQGEKNTVLRIDAIFEEDYRHAVHLSNGSVESSEYQDIQQHLDAIELMKKEAAEAEMERQERLAKKNFETGEKSSANAPGGSAASGSTSGAPAMVDASVPTSSTVADLMKPDTPPTVGPRAGESLEEYASELRHQVEKRVKFPGAALKSAPFHSAGTMKSLPSGTEVLIVISTPYWFGVETHDGQHGWITREELEELK